MKTLLLFTGKMLVPSGDNEHHRFIRSSSTCNIPKKMSDSELDCISYPSNVFCNQTCIFGHTLKGGIRRQMSCNYEDDKWSPVPMFENCKPFVDCTLTLRPGGKYKCYTDTMNKGPTCMISCAHYEDMPAVPEDLYECDIRGNWTPKLPFCVTGGSAGLKLMPRPKVLMVRPEN